jgi:hypothetical protein
MIQLIRILLFIVVLVSISVLPSFDCLVTEIYIFDMVVLLHLHNEE